MNDSLGVKRLYIRGVPQTLTYIEPIRMFVGPRTVGNHPHPCDYPKGFDDWELFAYLEEGIPLDRTSNSEAHTVVHPYKLERPIGFDVDRALSKDAEEVPICFTSCLTKNFYGDGNEQAPWSFGELKALPIQLVNLFLSHDSTPKKTHG
jgi:hypothetical protein